MAQQEMIGELLAGHYRVLEKLGGGGFGQTYIAEDTHRPGNPHCVVKHLKPASNNPKVLETARKFFQKEAETLESLGNHDRIPRLLAYFEENEQFYLVQEYIEGHTLAKELTPNQPWEESKVIALLQEILPILDFIHTQGVIHRDLKPDNLIRRSSDDKLVLIDFGAIKQLRNQTITESGELSVTVAIGTPGYMPTEQTRGTPRPNSDLYALGMICIQALTGKMPVFLPEDPDTGEILWQNLVTASPNLISILTKMVRYHFKDRYQSASEVLEALSGSQKQFTPIPPTEPPQAGAVAVNELILEWEEAGQPRSWTIREGQTGKNPGTFRIGRDPARCDLVLSDPMVSGLHAEIFFDSQQQRFWLRSLTQNSVTVVNGQPLSNVEVPLRHGSRLKLGQTDLQATVINPGHSPVPIVANQPLQPQTPPSPPVTPRRQNLSTSATVAISPAARRSSPATPPPVEPESKVLPWVLGLTAAILVGGLGGLAVNSWQNPIDRRDNGEEECFVLATGNLRSQPASFNDDSIVRVANNEKLLVTGKQTKNGWVEVNLGEGKRGWAHRDVITNETEMDDCLEEQDIEVKIVPDVTPPKPKDEGIELLKEAKELADQGELENAIATANKIDSESKAYQEGQEYLAKWRKQLAELKDKGIELLKEAKELADQGELENAIAKAREIDSESKAYQEGQEYLAKWRKQLAELKDKGIELLKEAKELADQGELENAIAKAREIDSESKAYQEGQEYLAKWRKQLAEQNKPDCEDGQKPVYNESEGKYNCPIDPSDKNGALDRVIPNFQASAILPEAAFAKCPGNTELYQLGETDKFNFAVCGKDGKPRFYLGENKNAEDGITVSWSNGFKNGSFLYEPPGYGKSNTTTDELQVYQDGKLVTNEKIQQLYQLN
ncbi:MAG: protein kinase [Kamptonema sp. SIO1D9]|nr:protein kinase [Kamptonema sp. SIO1D9]